MWKWLTVAALAYGLIAVGFVMSPRGTALGHFLEMVELEKAWQDNEVVPEVISFEFPVPEFQTIPATKTEVIHVEDGQHVLHWEPDPAEPVNVLIIPTRPGLVRPTGIELRFRGEGISCIATGVRERDGSLYSRLHPVGGDWQQVRLTLGELALDVVSEDENGRLDPGQLEGMFIAILSGEALRDTLDALPPRLRRQLKRRLLDRKPDGQIYLELDDIGIMGQTAPGPGSPLDGETSQRDADGPRQPPGEGYPPRGEGDPGNPPPGGQPGERPPHSGQPRSADT